MRIEAGEKPIGIRQSSAATFAGEVPKKGFKNYEPFVDADTKIVAYSDPDDTSLTALDQGGLYDFEDQTILMKEVRSHTGNGDISVVVGDRKDASSMNLAVGGSTPAIDLVAAGVIAGDIVTVTVGGDTEVYTSVEVLDSTTLLVDSVITEYSLVAPNSFSIVGRDGTVRYSHTLAGADTLGITSTTAHDVLVATPATGHLTFDGIGATVLPSQIVKVSTASSDSNGFIDIYIVKGDWF